MSTPHKASLRDWESVKKTAELVGSADCSVILELAGRLTAAEGRIEELIFAKEALRNRLSVLEEGYDEQAARLETVETGKPYRLEDANSSAGLTGSNQPAPPDSSSPAGGLVELVRSEIMNADWMNNGLDESVCGDDDPGFRYTSAAAREGWDFQSEQSRAAILACADYLEDRADHTGARWLREEVGQ
jgi:hypothetical protein